MTNKCSSGRLQSPIKINSNKVIKCGALCDLIFYYRTSKCNLQNTKDNIIMDYDNGSYVMYNNEVYELDKISFSIPGCHRIDNSSYPIEIHIHHRSPDSGVLLIIAIQVDINDASSKSKLFLDLFGDNLPSKPGQQVHINTPSQWNVFDMVPETKAFFNYKGSLVRSPCAEGVIWIIMDSSINCSNNFYFKLKNIIPKNARDIQKLNNRKIYYNPNTADKNNRNYGSKLRCYNDKQFRKACSKLTSQKDIIDSRNKQVLLLTITVCIFVTMILFILWLIQQDFFSKTADNIKKFLSTKIFLPKNE